jgi:hypothetical protein
MQQKKKRGRPSDFEFIQKEEVDHDMFQILGNSKDIPQLVRKRASILQLSCGCLPCSEIVHGMGNNELAVSPSQVRYWQRKYMKQGSSCIWEHLVARSKNSGEFVKEIRRVLSDERPPRGDKWKAVDLAARMQVSRSYFYKILQKNEVRLADLDRK